MQEHLDIAPTLERRTLFALTVNGDSMKDTHIADGDVVLMEPCAILSPASRAPLSAPWWPAAAPVKHFHLRGGEVSLEAANPNYEPITLPAKGSPCRGNWWPSGARSGVSSHVLSAARTFGAIAQLVKHLRGMRGSEFGLLGSIAKEKPSL